MIEVVEGESCWFSQCDGRSIEIENVTDLCYHSSLGAIVAIVNGKCLKILDENSGEVLQDSINEKNVSGAKIKCVYHEVGMGIAITDGVTVGYRRHSNGLLLLNNSLQTPIKSAKDVVSIELLYSEATLLVNYILEAKSTIQLDLDDKQPFLNRHFTEFFETLKNIVDKENIYISHTKPYSKWRTVVISLPYEVIKSACETLLEPHFIALHDLQADKKYYPSVMIESLETAYGLPILSSILHRLVLLFPTDNPGCCSKVIKNPNRSLMYSELTRQATFTDWPHQRYRWALPDAMAQAGFYHQPSARGDDRAMCFACNVCLVCWEPADEPWSEHERHSPNCPFVCGEPTVNIPLSLTYSVQPAHKTPFSKPTTMQFICIGQNSGYLIAASGEGHIAMWNVNKLTKLVAKIRVTKETIADKFKDQIFTAEDEGRAESLVCRDFEVTAVYLLDNLSQAELRSLNIEDKIKSKDGDDKEVLKSQTPVIVLAVKSNLDKTIRVVENETSEQNENASKDDETNAASLKLSFLTSNHSVSALLMVQPTLKKSSRHRNIPRKNFYEHHSHQLSLSEMTVPDMQLDIDPYDTDPIVSQGPTPNNCPALNFETGGLVNIPANNNVPSSEEENSMQNEDEELSSASIVKPTETPTAPERRYSCTPANMKIPAVFIDHKVSWGGETTAVREVTNILCDTESKNLLLSLKHCDMDKNGICKFTIINKQLKFALPHLHFMQIVKLPPEFAEVPIDPDNEDDSGLESNMDEDNVEDKIGLKDISCEEYMMGLTSHGVLHVINIGDVESVHSMTIQDVVDDTQSITPIQPIPNEGGDTDTNLALKQKLTQQITSFAYCSGTSSVCVASNDGKLYFVKVGKQVKSQISSDESDSAKQQNRSSLNLLTDKPLTTKSLQEMLAVIRTEGVSPRFNCWVSNSWNKVFHETNSAPPPAPRNMMASTSKMKQYKGLLVNPTSSGMQTPRRHLHHPNQHQRADVAPITHTWTLQPDSVSWDQHLFDITLPRATNVSHAELRFVLRNKLPPGIDIEISLVRAEELLSPRSSRDRVPQFAKSNSLSEKITEKVEKMTRATFPKLGTVTPSTKGIKLLVTEIVHDDIDTQYTSAVLADKNGCKVNCYFNKRNSEGLLKNGCVIEMTSYYNMHDDKILCSKFVSVAANADGVTDIDAVDAFNLQPLSPQPQLSPPKEKPKLNSSSENRKIISGPIKLSKVTDVTGIGGTAVLYFTDMFNDVKVTNFAIKLKAVGEASWNQTIKGGREDWLRKGCNCLQEVSITVHKFVKDKSKIHRERAQRMSILNSENLPLMLLEALIKPSYIEDPTLNSLPAKLAILDLLCWITTMLQASQKLPNTVVSIFSKPGNFDCLEFLRRCVINAHKEVALKSTQFLFLTLFSEKFHLDIGFYVNDILTCIEECSQRQVKTDQGMNYLFRILHVVLMDKIARGEQDNVLNIMQTLFHLLKKCGTKLSTDLHPIHSQLRLKYGFYGTPCDSELFCIDANAARSSGVIRPNFDNKSPPTDETKENLWEKYFSKEELNIIDLMTSGNVSLRSVLGAVDMRSGYAESNFGVLDSIPLHFKVVSTSEGCNLDSPDKSNESQSVTSAKIVKSTLSQKMQEVDSINEKNESEKLEVLKDMLSNIGNLEKHVEQVSQSGKKKLSNENDLTNLEDQNETKSTKGGATKLPPLEYLFPHISPQSPYLVEISISRMHSGARRHVTLDFGHAVSISSVFIPLCRDLSSLTVETWLHGDKNEPKVGTSPIHITTVVDICDHDLNLKNVSPPIVCQFMKISFIGRYGTTNTHTNMLLGRFYGVPACVGIAPEQDSPPAKRAREISTVDSFVVMSPFECSITSQGKAAIHKFMSYLRACIDDTECKYTLASNRLQSLLAKNDMDFSRISSIIGQDTDSVESLPYLHLQERIKTSQEKEYQNILSAYQETINCQIRLCRLSRTLTHFISLIDYETAYSLDQSDASFSQNEMYSYLLVNTLLSSSRILKPSTFKTELINQHDCLHLFRSICYKGCPRLRIATALTIMQYCAMWPWWGNFFATALTDVSQCPVLESSSIYSAVKQEHLYSMILVLGRRSLGNSKIAEAVTTKLLKFVSTLLPQKYGFTTGGLNVKLLNWVVLFLTQTIESIVTNNEKIVSELTKSTSKKASDVKTDTEANSGSSSIHFPKTKATSSKVVAPPPPSIISMGNRWSFITMSRRTTETVVSPPASPKMVTKVYKPIGGVQTLATKKAHITAMKNMLEHKLKQAKQARKLKSTTDSPTNTTAFVQISVEVTKQVLKNIIELLLNLDVSIPSDFIVLLCKLASQLVKWCGLQTVYEKSTPVIRLSNIVTSENLKKLILVLIGGNVGSKFKGHLSRSNARGPWLNHALTCFLQDILEAENFVHLQNIRLKQTLERSKETDVISMLEEYNSPQKESETEEDAELDKDEVEDKEEEIVPDLLLFSDSQKKEVEDSTDTNVKGWLDSMKDILFSPVNEAKSKPIFIDTEPPSSTSSFPATKSLAFSPPLYNDFSMLSSEEKLEIYHPQPPSYPAKPNQDLQNPKPNLFHAPRTSFNLEMGYKMPVVPNPHLLCSMGTDQRTGSLLYNESNQYLQLNSLTNLKLTAESISFIPHSEMSEKTSPLPDQDGVNTELGEENTSEMMKSVLGELISLANNSYSIPIETLIDFILQIQQLMFESPNSVKILTVDSFLALLGAANNQRFSYKLQQQLLQLCTVWVFNKYVDVDGGVFDQLLAPGSNFGIFLSKLMSTSLVATNVGVEMHLTQHGLVGPSITTQFEQLTNTLLSKCKPDDTYVHMLCYFMLYVVQDLAMQNQFLHTSSAATDLLSVFVHAAMENFPKDKSKCRLNAEIALNVVEICIDVALKYFQWIAMCPSTKSSSRLQTFVFMSDPMSKKMDSIRDQLVLNMLLLCAEIVACPVVEPNLENDEVENSANVSCLLLQKQHVMNNIFLALSLCNNSLLISLISRMAMGQFNSEQLKTFPVSVADGMYILACTISDNIGDFSVEGMLPAIMTYMLSENERGPVHKLPSFDPITYTCPMSEPLCSFFTNVLKDPEIVLKFCLMGGVKLIVESLVLATCEGIDQNPDVISNVMQFISSSADRSAANAPLPYVQATQESSPWPTLAAANAPGSKKVLKAHSGPSMPMYYASVVGGNIPQPQNTLMSDVKLQSSETGQSLVNFAPNATIECSDRNVHVPDSLLKNKSIHRRARSPAWSYHFAPGKQWISLTLRFPDAFVLKSVVLCPMIMSLSSSPAFASVEVSRLSSSLIQDFYPISGVLAMSGLSKLCIQAPTQQVIKSMRINLAKPVDSMSLGLTKIMVNGIPVFKSLHVPPDKSTMASKTLAHFSHTVPSNGLSQPEHWLSILHQCMSFENLQAKILQQVNLVPYALQTLCFLLHSKGSVLHHSSIEILLVNAAVNSLDSAQTLLAYLIKGSPLQSNLLNASQSTASESSVNVIYQYGTTQTQDDEFSQRLLILYNVIADIINKRLSYSPIDYNVLPAHIHAIACLFWKNAKNDLLKESVSDEVVLNLLKWIQQLYSVRLNVSPLLNALQWFLCALCNLDHSKFIKVLSYLGMNSLSIESLSGDNVKILTFVSQSIDSFKYLLNEGHFQYISMQFINFCKSLLKEYIVISPETDIGSTISAETAVNVIQLFTTLCHWKKVQNWLGSAEGKHLWINALKLLYHVLPKLNIKNPHDSSDKFVTQKHLLELQDELMKFLKSFVLCNENNQILLAKFVVELLQSKTGLTGLLKSVILCVFLETEKIIINMTSESGTKLPNGKCNSKTNLSSIMHHPMYSTGHYSRTNYVNINSNVKHIRNIFSDSNVLEQINESSKDTKRLKLQPKVPENVKMHPQLLSTGSDHSLANSSKLKDSFFKALGKMLNSNASSKTISLKPSSTSTSLISQDSDPSSSESSVVQNAALSAIKKRHKASSTPTKVTNSGSMMDELPLLVPDMLVSCAGFGNVPETMKTQDIVDHSQRNPDIECLSLKLSLKLSKVSSDGKESPVTNDAESKDETESTSEVDKIISSAIKESTSVAEKTNNSLLKHFADSGGLTLLASLMSVNTQYKIFSTDQQEMKSSSQDKITNAAHEDDFEYLYNSDDEMIYDVMPAQDMPYIPSKSASDMKSNASSNSNAPVQNLPVGVPGHTMAILCMFLRLPHYANHLLKQGKISQCLLRLLLGVMDDGEGGQIMELPLASDLLLGPFHSMRQLLEVQTPDSDAGKELRKAMISDSLSLHLLLACYAYFTHHEPDSNTLAWKSLKMLMPDPEPPVPNVSPMKKDNKLAPKPPDSNANIGFGGHNTKPAASSNEQLFWAKGTGFATGSTASDWNINNAVKKQQQEEQYITAILQVLSNYICPEGSISSVELETEKTKLIISLFISSGLFRSLASYLRNDSVLDMASHVPLYQAILMILRAMAKCSFTSRLLVYTPSKEINPEEGASEPDAILAESLIELLQKMRVCVDRYAQRLKKLGNSSDAHLNTEGLNVLVSDVQKTNDILNKLSLEVKEKENANTASTSKDAGGSVPGKIPLASLEERYIKEMKQLQFDTHELVTANEKGKLTFNVSHYYASQIQSVGQVSNPNRALRLAQEAVTLSNSLPLSYSSTVFVRCDEERLDTMKVLMTGPVDTPYANGCFEFDVFFPAGYNQAPPLVNLQTTGHNRVRFNPNLYNDGKVCLSILNTWHGRPEEKWNPQTSSFLQVLVSIQSLILVAEPYFNEPGYERSRGTAAGTQSSREYDANIQQATVRWAMLDQLKNPSACFKEVIEKHFWLKKEEILAQCEEWLADMKKHVKSQSGRGSISNHCAALKSHLDLLRNALFDLKCPAGLEDKLASQDK